MIRHNFDDMSTSEAKIRNYSNNPGIDAVIRLKQDNAEVRYFPLVPFSKGIWC